TECCHPRRRERCVSERGLWTVGAALPSDGAACRLFRTAFISVYRRRLADSRLLGRRASPLGQPHLALHADVLVRLHGFRHDDRSLVSARRAFISEAPVAPLD